MERNRKEWKKIGKEIVPKNKWGRNINGVVKNVASVLCCVYL